MKVMGSNPGYLLNNLFNFNQDKQQQKQQPFVAAAEQQSVTVTPPIAPPIAAVTPVVAPLVQAQVGQFATQLKFSQILV